VKGSLGRFGETWTRGYLARKGYRILDSNVRYRVGELDIVAECSGELVFVEVKCRRSSEYGSPADAVTATKYGRLARAIETYLQVTGRQGVNFRLDVVALEVDSRGAVSRVTHLEGVEAPSA
jgi:putative endonuclease